MENYQIEAQAQDNCLTISALTTKKESIEKNGFTYERKFAEITELARYEYVKVAGIILVKVVANNSEK